MSLWTLLCTFNHIAKQSFQTILIRFECFVVQRIQPFHARVYTDLYCIRIQQQFHKKINLSFYIQPPQLRSSSCSSYECISIPLQMVLLSFSENRSASLNFNLLMSHSMNWQCRVCIILLLLDQYIDQKQNSDILVWQCITLSKSKVYTLYQISQFLNHKCWDQVLCLQLQGIGASIGSQNLCDSGYNRYIPKRLRLNRPCSLKKDDIFHLWQSICSNRLIYSKMTFLPCTKLCKLRN